MKKQDFKGWLLVSDIDGTVLNHEFKTAPENLTAIQNFVERGGLFTVGTGRAPASAAFVSSAIPKTCPGVVLNGGAIYDFDSNRFLWQKQLHQEAVEVVEYIQRKFPFTSIEIHVGHDIYLVRSSPKGDVHISEAGADIHRVSMEQVPKTGWNKVLFAAEEEQMQYLISQIADIPLKEDRLVRTSTYYYEVLPRGIDKGVTVHRLAEMLQIPKEHICCIGDYYNDLEMLRSAAFSACVASSPDSIKSEVDMVCPDVMNGSLAYFIQEIENKLI